MYCTPLWYAERDRLSIPGEREGERERKGGCCGGTFCRTSRYSPLCSTPRRSRKCTQFELFIHCAILRCFFPPFAVCFLCLFVAFLCVLCFAFSSFICSFCGILAFRIRLCFAPSFSVFLLLSATLSLSLSPNKICFIAPCLCVFHDPCCGSCFPSRVVANVVGAQASTS